MALDRSGPARHFPPPAHNEPHGVAGQSNSAPDLADHGFNAQEFDRIVAGAWARWVEHCAARVGDRDIAKDVVQEALALAWERRQRYSKRRGPLETWLAQCCYRRSLQWLRDTVRARRREQRVRAGLTSAAATCPASDQIACRSSVLHQEREEVVWDAIMQLPERQRIVAIMRLRFARPVAEVAARLGVRPGTVKALLHMARRNLRAYLLDRGIDPSQSTDVLDILGASDPELPAQPRWNGGSLLAEFGER